MSHSRRRLSLLAMLAGTAVIVAACGGAATPSPSASEAPSAAPSEAPTAAPFEAMVYPESGEAPCGDGTYTGEFKKITAVDAKTVVFDLCTPDVAFLSKIAFSSFAINDTAWLEANIDPAATEGQKIVDNQNGTGPYKLTAWNRGTDITLDAFDGYWGDKALTPKLIVRWSAEAAQRLVELQAGTADGIDNIGPTDFDIVKNDPNLQLQ